MSLVISRTKIQMTYIYRDENSNDLYLQGRNTYLSQPPLQSSLATWAPRR